MTEHRPHSVSVAGIVVNDEGKVLVIRRRDNNRWEPPGGILEIDETFEEGVRREVHEETGIWVKVERVTGIYKNMNRGIVALVFRCAVEHGDLTTSPESADVQWMSLDDMHAVMVSAYAVRVADAFGKIVAIRTHDGIELFGSDGE